jgi:hypothetical protein
MPRGRHECQSVVSSTILAVSMSNARYLRVVLIALIIVVFRQEDEAAPRKRFQRQGVRG